ncbi:hypothetical protein HAX54_048717 [Datura stramonium]|uniref:Uncharacterized protein n=1 Tax=Datura stramonium TaxID=4076 RepID=A0ABS8SU59_DATST|nr:hypothetical protein [Datura stramonium]
MGTKRGPATRGTVKKSLDLILKESHQNTLKRRQVTKATVLDEKDQSSPIVYLDTEVPSQVMEESPKVEKKSLCSAKVSKKGKQLSVGENLLKDQSTVSSFTEAQHRGTEEIERLTMLLAQKDAEIAVLKAAQSGEAPGALSDLQEENASLKSDNASLRKQLEDLTQQITRDQRAANERIDKLLSKM